MSKPPRQRPYRLYPAYCFPHSPTFNAWVKLAVADVHALRSEADFQGQNIYFYHNHPVRYVRVVGVVVAIDDITSRYSALTLDDGSGATIELKIVRHVAEEQMKTVSTTTISNVNVISHFGVFDITIDHVSVDIGTVLKAKGTISEFRGIKQLELKRVQIVSSTDEEVRAWAETAAFKSEVLSAPWRVTSSMHREILAKKKADGKKAREYEKRVKEYEVKKKEYEAKKSVHEAKKETKREARRRREEAMMNAGALV